MEYDINIHLPQQVENFMNAFAQGDSEALERIKKNILILIPDGSFHKDLGDYEQDRKNRIQSLIDKTIENVQRQTEKPKNEETLYNIQTSLKQLEGLLNTVEGDYWATINEYMITWLNKQKDE